MSTISGRLVPNNLVVYSQAEFYQADGFTRVTGLTPLQLALEVYYNNGSIPWALQVGVGIPDSMVTSGQVYLDSFSTGSYGIRWRPNAIGYWRLRLSYPVGLQILNLDYDVSSAVGVAESGSGLKVSFVK